MCSVIYNKLNKRNKKQTKENIISAAIQLFESKGLIDTSTLDIAKIANVAHGTIFYYYPKRSDLIIAAIYTKMARMGYELHERSRYSENIEEICSLFIDGVLENRKFYSVIAKEVPLLPLNVQRMVFASMSGFSTHFVEVLKRGQKNKKVPEFSPKLAIFYWFGMINYLFAYPEMLGTKKTLKKNKQKLIRMFVKMIKDK